MTRIVDQNLKNSIRALDVKLERGARDPDAIVDAAFRKFESWQRTRSADEYAAMSLWMRTKGGQVGRDVATLAMEEQVRDLRANPYSVVDEAAAEWRAGHVRKAVKLFEIVIATSGMGGPASYVVEKIRELKDRRLVPVLESVVSTDPESWWADDAKAAIRALNRRR
jgi:hypothetical protein